MLALVDFPTEQEKGGPVPCEIVHISWLKEDLNTCFWPGNRNYASEFKLRSQPGDHWKDCKVKVKFVSEEIIEQPDAGNLVLDIPVASCTQTVIPSSTSNFMEEDTSSLLKALLTRLTRIELKIDNLSKDIQLLKKFPAVPTVKPQEYPDLPLTR
ncbi:unnamed protein product, partial [Allacma fusca]